MTLVHRRGAPACKEPTYRWGGQTAHCQQASSHGEHFSVLITSGENETGMLEAWGGLFTKPRDRKGLGVSEAGGGRGRITQALDLYHVRAPGFTLRAMGPQMAVRSRVMRPGTFQNFP